MMGFHSWSCEQIKLKKSCRVYPEQRCLPEDTRKDCWCCYSHYLDSVFEDYYEHSS